MAHEIRSTDRFGEVRSRGERAWHGLGVEIAKTELAKLEQQVLAMVGKGLSVAELETFAINAFSASFSAPSKDDLQAFAKWEGKRVEIINRWTELFEQENARTPSISGTVWAAFNEVTEWHDHERGRFDDVKNSDARVHSNLFGVSHVAKGKTLRLALSKV